MKSNEPIMVNDKTAFEKVKFVASALIENNEGKVLAIKLKDTNGEEMFIPPGGRPELGETLRECVIREVKEEVGIDIEIISIAGILEKLYESGIWTFVLYHARIIKGKVQNNECEEIKMIKMIDLKDLDNYKSIHWLK